MDIKNEQKIQKTDLQALIEESNRHKQREKSYRIAQLIITPLIITLVSVGVTWCINMQQRENTKQITEKQIKSAQIIAEANREQSAKTSESSQRIERLKQIKEIFVKLLIVTDDHDSSEIQSKKMQIISMEVYEEDALIFLLNLKEHYQVLILEQSCCKDLNDQVDKSIFNILSNGQVNVPNKIFVDCVGPKKSSSETLEKALTKFRQEFMKASNRRELINLKDDKGPYASFVSRYKNMQLNEMNLRQQEYKNYNFSDCSFLSVNIYSADFSDCTLKNNIFMNVDLQETSFSGSDLSSSIFIGSNLKKVNFMDSRLRNVIFVNPILSMKDASKKIKTFCKKNSCCQMEGAQFALGSLLYTDKPPFDIFDIPEERDEKYNEYNKLDEAVKKERQNLYINLLMNHHESITLKAEASENADTKDEDIANLLKNTATDNLSKLIQLLKKAKERAKIWETAVSLTKDTSARAL